MSETNHARGRRNMLLLLAMLGIPLVGIIVDQTMLQAADDGPVLSELMRDLGQDMATTTAAMWREDWPAVATAAQRVADHPRVGPSERQRVQQTLGDDFGRFAAADRAVHEAAVRLAAQAATGNAAAIADAYGELASGCVACHASFRDRLRPAP